MRYHAMPYNKIQHKILQYHTKRKPSITVLIGHKKKHHRIDHHKKQAIIETGHYDIGHEKKKPTGQVHMSRRVGRRHTNRQDEISS